MTSCLATGYLNYLWPMKLLLFFPLLFPLLVAAQAPEIELSKGQVISQTCRVKAATYKIAAAPADLFLPDTARGHPSRHRHLRRQPDH